MDCKIKKILWIIVGVFIRIWRDYVRLSGLAKPHLLYDSGMSKVVKYIWNKYYYF